MNYHNPQCSACGRKLKDDEEFRVGYYAQLGLTLCQNPAYQRGESDKPGCKDKIVERLRSWADAQGQQELGAFA